MLKPSLQRIILFWTVKYLLFLIAFAAMFGFDKIFLLSLADQFHFMKPYLIPYATSLIILSYPLKLAFNAEIQKKHFLIVAAIFIVEFLFFTQFDRNPSYIAGITNLVGSVIFYVFFFLRYTRTME